METYETISTYHKDYLAGAGVKLPQLEKGGEFTKDALVLVYLAQGYPDTRWITKKELTDFVRLYLPIRTMCRQDAIWVCNEASTSSLLVAATTSLKARRPPRATHISW